MGRIRRKKKKNSRGIPLVVFVVVVFCCCVGVRTNALKQQSARLAAKQKSLEKQIKSEEQRTKDLEVLEKYMKTKKYMEDVAREKLGLVYPDEIIIEPENK